MVINNIYFKKKMHLIGQFTTVIEFNFAFKANGITLITLQ